MPSAAAAAAVSTVKESQYPFPLWCTVYAAMLGIGLVASVAATWTLRKHAKLISSCVCSAMLHFFLWKTIFTVFRIAAVGVLLDEFHRKSSTWFVLNEDHDVGGIRFIGLGISKGDSSLLEEPPEFIRVLVFLGDASLIAGAYWILVLVVELHRLVRTTVDRGAVLEQKYTRIYWAGNIILLVAYLAASIAISNKMNKPFYSSRFHYFLVASSVAQTVVIAAVTLSVLYLSCTGQQLESVECRIVQKPLYIRLKLILLIYDITSLPFFAVGWAIAFLPTTPEESLDVVPSWILASSNVLYYTSPVLLAFVLVANQRCVLSWCMVPDDVIQQIQANEPPTDFPVFVNTDIESSSALWGALGHGMHDAQDIHDTLLRTLLVPHRGYEITTAGDSFQLAFHNIADAVAYCLDVQMQLLAQPWPQAFLDCQMPGSATITTQQFRLRRQKHLFHGVRVRMGIHASTPAEGSLVNQVHPVTGRMMYVGLSELIGREVSDLGCGGQIVVTAPIVRWLRANTKNGTPWAKAHPLELRELGVHHIADLRIDVGIAQIVPLDLVDRLNVFPPLSNLQSSNFRLPGGNYSLLISPQARSRVHIVSIN